MLNFLRKHQRIFFIVITAMVVMSLTFFGTFSTLGVGEKAPDKEIGKALDGTPIMEREIQAMSRFLSMGETTFLQNEFIGAGLAGILGEKYFTEIKDEFEPRLARAQKYKPYQHPQAPFISADGVWQRFMPHLHKHIQELKSSLLSPEGFALFCQLYLDQTAFPPHLLRKILYYQEQQHGWVQHDSEISDQRLSLFGFQSPEDWFGPKFLELTCKFLINSAVVAHEKGYQISNDEARADLLQNALFTLQTYTQKRDATYADADEFLRQQFKMLGIDEGAAVKLWKKVMLCRRLFDEVGQGVFLDDLTYKQFAAYAGETATLELYQLPEALRLFGDKNLRKFQVYLDTVTSKGFSKFPPLFLSPEKVESKFPELVHSRFLLEVSKVSKEDLSLNKITLKETWDFEMSDEGWEVLKGEFPILRTTEMGRFEALEKMDQNTRLKVDRFACSCIIGKHPEWLEEALATGPKEQIRVGIRSKGMAHPFTDVENPSELLEKLYGASLNETLPLFTANGNTYYRITVLEKPSGKEIMTFAEAEQAGVLDELADKKYPEGVKLENRLASYVQEAKKSIEKEGEDSLFLKISGNALRDQFALVKSSIDIKRSSPSSLSKEEMFAMHEGSWSSLQTPQNGDISFFRMLKKEKSTDSIEEELSSGHKILSIDARRFLMHNLLERM